MDQIPPELLCYIFSLACAGQCILVDQASDFSMPPISHPSPPLPTAIVLLSVCNLWKNVAETTSTLWNTVEVRYNEARASKERQLDRFLTALDIILCRSGSAPLHVRLIGNRQSRLQSYERQPGTMMVWGALLQHCVRLASFQACQTDIIDALFRKHDFPALSSLYIHGGAYTALNIAGNLPNLRHYTMINIHILTRIDVPWHQLTSLCIHFSSPRNRMQHLSWRDILQPLETMPQLVDLCANFAGARYSSWNVNPYKRIELPHLQTLELQNSSHIFEHSLLQQISTPKLMSVDLVVKLHDSGSVDMVRHFLSQSNLRQLRICFCASSLLDKYEFGSWKHLGYMQGDDPDTWSGWRVDAFPSIGQLSDSDTFQAGVFQLARLSRSFVDHFGPDALMHNMIGTLLKASTPVQRTTEMESGIADVQCSRVWSDVMSAAAASTSTMVTVIVAF
ncbi:hypothetical protein FA15DRAFT_667782 [Coprinopsis marcescibilis]|uniref:Uncharacterized protein n=1 Tax=Coprinopsis marcescibilis TaxID=230819 RepID=A0A5C3L010_COPMA|nr:hypothetical protein FA15DRAFT_667782 [Coprinopsis marcescibilis]